MNDKQPQMKGHIRKNRMKMFSNNRVDLVDNLFEPASSFESKEDIKTSTISKSLISTDNYIYFITLISSLTTFQAVKIPELIHDLVKTQK